MDTQLISGLLMILLWALFVLLPMLPAIIIYKFCPDTKVSIRGPLHGLDLKASGAFAAYVVTALLGSILMLKAQDQIKEYPGLSQQVTELQQLQRWTAVSKVQFVDSNGAAITENRAKNLLDSLTIYVEPNDDVRSTEIVKFTIPTYDMDGVVTFSVDGFTTESVKLLDVTKVDSTRRLEIGAIMLILDKQEDHGSTTIPQRVTDGPALTSTAVTDSLAEGNVLLANNQ